MYSISTHSHDSRIVRSLAKKILGPERLSFCPGISAISPQTMNKDNATNINRPLASSRLRCMKASSLYRHRNLPFHKDLL